TAIQDNPRLTARLWQGKNPVRVLLDPELTIPPTLNIFSNESDTLIFNGVSQMKNGHLAFEKIDFTGQVQQQVLERLYDRSIQSVIIEGGSITLQHFIDAGLWDEARIITSPVYWKKGIKAPVINGRVSARENIGGDTVTWMYRETV
ncbi:MAG TPA: dihydrofolate reductase family protein, partial [Bacteroidia bacterium]|nr:dihydrofolate reductase family protein [Bacteroidia bacterium]